MNWCFTKLFPKAKQQSVVERREEVNDNFMTASTGDDLTLQNIQTATIVEEEIKEEKEKTVTIVEKIKTEEEKKKDYEKTVLRYCFDNGYPFIPVGRRQYCTKVTNFEEFVSELSSDTILLMPDSRDTSRLTDDEVKNMLRTEYNYLVKKCARIYEQNTATKKEEHRIKMLQEKIIKEEKKKNNVFTPM